MDPQSQAGRADRQRDDDLQTRERFGILPFPTAVIE
jgi:hypothetical protein